MISAKKNNFIVEFRPSTIRAARISSESVPTVIEEVAEFEWSDETTPAAAIREFAKAKGNGYLQAACAVYPKDRVVRRIMVDASRGKEVDFVVNYLRGTLGVDPDTFSVYCLSIEDGGEVDLSTVNKKDILVCGSSKTAINEVQQELLGCAIYPRRLELGTLGTIGALKSATSNGANRSPILFLEIDEESTNAVIVGSNGVEMARRIDSGSQAFALALKEEMNLKDEAAAEKILQSEAFDLAPFAPKLLRKLLRELQSSIGFFEVQTGSSVSELYCLKSGHTVGWLESSICDLLNLTPLKLDLGVWLETNGVSFASAEVSEQVDHTWLGLLALAMELEAERARS